MMLWCYLPAIGLRDVPRAKGMVCVVLFVESCGHWKRADELVCG